MSETKAPDIPEEIREAEQAARSIGRMADMFVRHKPTVAFNRAELDCLASMLQDAEKQILNLIQAHRIASLAMAHGRQEAAWQPIETAPKDDAVILRPHYIWGAMDVRRGPVTTIDGKTQPWINGDMTTAWPEEAFLPYWMPRPANPAVAKEGTER